MSILKRRSFSMKVLLVNSLYYPNVIGGAERSVQFLAEALLAEGVRVSVLSLNPKGTHTKAEVNGVPVHYVPLPNFYWGFGRVKKTRASILWHAMDIFNPLIKRFVRRVIRQENPQVLHTNLLVGLSVAVWKTARELGVPIVHTLRDYYLACPKSQMYAEGRNCDQPCRTCSLFSRPKNHFSSLVNSAVGNSRFILDKHLALGYFRNATEREVIHNIYTPSASIAAVPATSARLRIGFIGQIALHKGVDHLINELQRLPDHTYELVIAGNGPDELMASLKALATSPSIRFLGHIKPEVFFNQIDALAVPSLWHEPLPRVIFEAYAYGIPVLATRRGGNGEIVSTGKTGFLYEPDQPGALRDLVQQLISDRSTLAGMRPACLQYAQNFLPSVIAGKYLKLYERTISATAQSFL